MIRWRRPSLKRGIKRSVDAQYKVIEEAFKFGSRRPTGKVRSFLCHVKLSCANWVLIFSAFYYEMSHCSFGHLICLFVCMIRIRCPGTCSATKLLNSFPLGSFISFLTYNFFITSKSVKNAPARVMGTTWSFLGLSRFIPAGDYEFSADRRCVTIDHCRGNCFH